jgi:hypothetical protein
MGKKIVYIILCLSFLILLSKVSFAQYIVAGQHGVNDVYTYSDTSLGYYGEWGFMQDSLELDIDRNGTCDFKIFGYGMATLAGRNIGCRVVCLNSFIDTHLDSTLNGTAGWIYRNVPNIHNNGEIINNQLNFVNSNLSFSSEIAGVTGVSVHEWDNIGEHYVAIKLIIPNDTLYGWISVQVQTSNYCKIIIKDYACNGNPNTIYHPTSETPLYPNPANEEMRIVFSSLEPQIINIYTIQGALLNTLSVNPGNDTYYYPDKFTYTIPTGIMANGMYIIKIESAKETVIKKFVVSHIKW